MGPLRALCRQSDLSLNATSRLVESIRFPTPVTQTWSKRLTAAGGQFCLPCARVNQHYNTGRETFLLPVQWKDGWPIILGHGKAIPYVVPGPKVTEKGDQAPSSGNFTWRDEFDSPNLDPRGCRCEHRSNPGTAFVRVRAPWRFIPGRWRYLRSTTLRSWHAASNTWHSMRAQLSSCPRAVTR